MLMNLKSQLPNDQATIGQIRHAFENIIQSEGAPTVFEIFKHTIVAEEEPIVALDGKNSIIFSSKGAQDLFEQNQESLNGISAARGKHLMKSYSFHIDGNRTEASLKNFSSGYRTLDSKQPSKYS